MIYLTQLLLDPRHRRTQELVDNPYCIHQRILNAWGESQPGRVLFRVEEPGRDAAPRGQRSLRLLVQAPEPGSWHEAFPHGELRELEEKAVELSLEPGQMLRFYLRANPTRREPGGNVLRADGTPKDGARHPLYREEEQRDWMRRKGEQNGFDLLALNLFDRGDFFSRKPRAGAWSARIKHHCVDFEGRLRVTDADRLQQCVTEGIGSGKGFGFGLLSLARAKP